MTESADPSSPAVAVRRLPKWAHVLGRGIGLVAIWIVVMIASVWSVLAIRYTNLKPGQSPRAVLPIIFAIALVAAMVLIRPRKYRLAAIAVLLVGVIGWYFSIPASNDRDWALDNTRAPYIDINGDEITVHNVRNIDWRSDTDFTPSWGDRTYKLSELCSVDLIFCHWGSKAIAHGIVSFGFSDGQFLAASIETRKERGEAQGTIPSFFRNFELLYIFADERDILRVRTNVRNEDVYLFRTNLNKAQCRKLLMSYINRANDLAKQAEFYNGLTSNCITNVVHMTKVLNPNVRVTWDMLLSGYAPQRAYRNGRLDRSMPFEQLEAKSLINDVAKAANDDPNFSQAIRAQLPVPPPAVEPADQ